MSKQKQTDPVKDTPEEPAAIFPDEIDFTRHRDSYRFSGKVNVVLAVLLTASMGLNLFLHYQNMNPLDDGHRSIIKGIDTRGGVHQLNMHPKDNAQ